MGNLTAGTITLDSIGHIKSGQSGYDNGTGFWLGRDGGVPKFSLGDSTGDNMTWDGSALTVSGDIILKPDAVDTINIADGATMRYWTNQESSFRNVSNDQPNPLYPAANGTFNSGDWHSLWGGEFPTSFTDRMTVEFLDSSSIKQVTITGWIGMPWVQRLGYDVIPRVTVGFFVGSSYAFGTGMTVINEQDVPTISGVPTTSSTSPGRQVLVPFSFTNRISEPAGTTTIRPVVDFLATSGAVWDPLGGSNANFNRINVVVQELRNTQ